MTTAPPAASCAAAFCTPAGPRSCPDQGRAASDRLVTSRAVACSSRADLTKRSDSRLTRSFARRFPSAVSLSVIGISATENRSRTISATVTLTPSSAMKPLATMSSRKCRGGRIHTRTPPPVSSLTRVTLPTASTRPWTRWPSRESPTLSGNSRLTRSPARKLASVLRLTVSGETSTPKQGSLISTADKHAPFTFTDPPTDSDPAVFGASMVSRRRTSVTVPTSVIRPVNMGQSSRSLQPATPKRHHHERTVTDGLESHQIVPPAAKLAGSDRAARACTVQEPMLTRRPQRSNDQTIEPRSITEVSGSGHEDRDVVGGAGGQGGQQGVAGLGEGQLGGGGQGAGQAGQAGSHAGGGGFDESIGVQHQGAAGRQVQPGGLGLAVGQAGAQRQVGPPGRGDGGVGGGGPGAAGGVRAGGGASGPGRG